MIKAMINVYCRLVKSGARTLESIPEDYREAVKALISPDDETGNESNDETDGE